jgi:hypothetical protein
MPRVEPDEPPMTAEQARDEALERVADNSGPWINAAFGAAVRRGQEQEQGAATFTGEQLRLMLLDAGLPPPHHHNAWGALINKLVRSGVIQPTGDRTRMKTERSHARSTGIYAWGTAPADLPPLLPPPPPTKKVKLGLR